MTVNDLPEGETTADLSQLIDLLVDDELDEKDRKGLLLKLDGSPDGWKQCALAFLETQMFARALRQPIHSAEPTNATATAKPRLPGFSRHQTKRQQWVSMASVVLAFGAGAVIFSGRSGDMSNTSASLSQVKTPVIAVGNVVEPVTFVVSEKKPPVRFLSMETPFVSVVPQKQPDHGPPQTEYVTFSNGKFSGETLIPCYLSSEIEAEQYLKSPPSISSNELQHILQQGNEIDIIRENHVVPAGKNRYAVIPVDQVIIKYASHRGVL